MSRALRFTVVAAVLWIAPHFAAADDWPQFRGPHRTGVSEEAGLLKEWPKEGPKVAWRAQGVGVGYSSVAIAGGRVYTLGAIDGVEQVIALDEATGRILWKSAPTKTPAYRNGQGDGPRSTPTVDHDRLYVELAGGDLACLQVADGKPVWVKSLVKDLGGSIPGWGYSESPLVVGRGLIVTPGGKEGAVAALDKTDGKVVWRSKAVTEGAHYCSPQLATIGGRKMIVQMAARDVFGLDLLDGSLLWKFDRANNHTANVAMPIVFADHVLASTAYGTGAALYAIAPDGPGFRTDEKYFEKKLANHHGGIVLVGDNVYGFGSTGLICMNLATGTISWVDRSVGKGSLIAADGMLYCLGEHHELGLVEANPAKYAEHGRIKLEDHDKPSWAHPALANKRLYIRDQDTLTAYDIAAK